MSDDTARSERRFRGLRGLVAIALCDLYDPPELSVQPLIIVSDVRELSADAVSRLRALLGRMRPPDGRLVLVAHGDGPRSRAYARVLGATETVPASDLDALPALIERLVVETGRVPLSAMAHAERARQFLSDTFNKGILTQAEVQNGTEAVARAIGAAGILDWIRVVREFDDATHQHILLVAGLAAAFAGTLGLAAPDRHRLTKAALLHDVGKTKVPAAILTKPGRLDAAEMAIMRTHAAAGHAMLLGQGFEAPVLAVARSHHEMLDGSGYPDGLDGRDIPDLVRLVTVCDVYGALIERRPYRAPLGSAEAFGILDGMAGRLDRVLIGAFKPVVIAPVIVLEGKPSSTRDRAGLRAPA
ncbi:HD domain-containing protein [Methylobacterium sp. J-088]|uniref:HD-GYP domain-containing protein n=1 Tax=Methylobacterium sp. J-088 TaxID=2836664 RepID=UPI001FB9CE60|nr:HD domain-containing phosphohydrolase [Methylobacterium sp. J-088]MCJ2061603.1 HD domain-containing protein [Methylobacterium sp. J-088]